MYHFIRKRHKWIPIPAEWPITTKTANLLYKMLEGTTHTIILESVKSV